MTVHVEGAVETAGRRAVDKLIADNLCKSVTYQQSTESTNTVALKDLRSGSVREDQLPKLYLADDQTAGRGRHGRSWLSAAGGLTFSLIIKRPRSDRVAGLVSLAVGIGIARGLEHEFAPLRTALKWPNDIHVDGGKLAGILIETSSQAEQRIVIGVGMNINHAPHLDGEHVRNESRSLSQVVGRTLHRYDVLGPTIEGIMHSVTKLHDDVDEVVCGFRDRCLLTGQEVTFRDGASGRRGICRGISDDGELIVQSDQGITHVRSGEASLVRTTRR